METNGLESIVIILIALILAYINVIYGILFLAALGLFSLSYIMSE